MKFLLFALVLVFTNATAQTNPQEGAAAQKNLLNNDKAQLERLLDLHGGFARDVPTA